MATKHRPASPIPSMKNATSSQLAHMRVGRHERAGGRGDDANRGEGPSRSSASVPASSTGRGRSCFIWRPRAARQAEARSAACEGAGSPSSDRRAPSAPRMTASCPIRTLMTLKSSASLIVGARPLTRLGGAGNPCCTTRPSPSPVVPWQGTQYVLNMTVPRSTAALSAAVNGFTGSPPAGVVGSLAAAACLAESCRSAGP